jgi:hypothetical protein
MTVSTYRYHLPSLPDWRDSWSIVFVDSTGTVAVCSDYGDWCYRWSVQHCGHSDFREFLLQADWHYVATKFGSGRREELKVYDGEETRKRIQSYILKTRRELGLSKSQARHEWALANSSVEDDGEVGFHHWIAETRIEEAFEFGVYRMSRGLEHWAKISFPRLQDAIRAELKSERGVIEETPGSP